MQHYSFALFPLLFSVSVSVPAQAVIYTTEQYPPINPPPGTVVQFLEDIPALEQQIFPALSQNPAQAEQQVQNYMHQPGWHEQEARLTRAYQALSDAYMLGIEKVPAVVLDNRYVVYGTTSVSLAEQKRDAWQKEQP